MNIIITTARPLQRPLQPLQFIIFICYLHQFAGLWYTYCHSMLGLVRYQQFMDDLSSGSESELDLDIIIEAATTNTVSDDDLF